MKSARLAKMMKLLSWLFVITTVKGSQDMRYVFSFIQTDYNGYFYGQLYIASASSSETRGNIILPFLEITIPFNVEPMSGIIIQLPRDIAQSGSGYQTSTIFVKADQHVYVYGYSYGYGNSDTFYPLPVATLGKEYYVMTHITDYNDYPTFSITSVYDNTVVEVYFNQPYNSYNSTHPMILTLTSLSTYVVRLSFDFSGTRIKSSEPVSVSSGLVNYGYPRSHIVEVMPPVPCWGKSFVVTSFAERSEGHLLKVVAANMDTNVHLIQSGQTYKVSNNGSLSITVPLHSPLIIESNKPILVVAFVEDYPFMTVIPALEQATKGPIPFYAFTSGSSYISVWTLTKDVNNVLLDEERVPWDVLLFDDSWGNILQTSVSHGLHFLRGKDDDIKFIGIVYGYDGSYAFGNPLSYKVLKEVGYEDTIAPALTLCHSVPVEAMQSPDQVNTSVSWMEPSATDEDGLPITMMSDYQPGDNFLSGNTTITYIFTDESGNKAMCSFDVVVHDVSPPVPKCPGYVRVDSCSEKAIVTWTEPYAWDNSDRPITITSEHGRPGDEFKGTSFVEYTFTDEAGNVASCSIEIVVNKDNNMCKDEALPYIITAVVLGLSLIPFVFTSGLFIKHRRSVVNETKPTPVKKTVKTITSPAPRVYDDTDVYEFAGPIGGGNR